MVLDRRVQLFVALTALFVTALLVGDIIGGKLAETTVGSTAFVISVGMIPFPITFLLTDLLNEFYGPKAARFVTIVGFFMALLAFLLLGIAMQVPWAGFTRAADWQGMTQPAFDNVFGGSRRILIASMIAYMIGQLVDIAIFHRLKQLTHQRLLWLRATGSTLVSQLIDTFVIQFIAWTGLLPIGEILRLAVLSYAVKLVVAIGLTPLIYGGHALVERRLGIAPVKVE